MKVNHYPSPMGERLDSTTFATIASASGNGAPLAGEGAPFMSSLRQQLKQQHPDAHGLSVNMGDTKNGGFVPSSMVATQGLARDGLRVGDVKRRRCSSSVRLFPLVDLAIKVIRCSCLFR